MAPRGGQPTRFRRKGSKHSLVLYYRVLFGAKMYSMSIKERNHVKSDSYPLKWERRVRVPNDLFPSADDLPVRSRDWDSSIINFNLKHLYLVW